MGRWMVAVTAGVLILRFDKKSRSDLGRYLAWMILVGIVWAIVEGTWLGGD
jgi:hypothetical protein